MRLFVQHLDPKSILNLRQEFKKIDTGQNGFIMVDELQQALEKSNIQLSQKEVLEIVSRIDF